MTFVFQALKAFYASLFAIASGLGVVLVGNASISDVTTAQWVTIGLGALVAFGGVYGVTNKP